MSPATKRKKRHKRKEKNRKDRNRFHMVQRSAFAHTTETRSLFSRLTSACSGLQHHGSRGPWTSGATDRTGATSSHPWDAKGSQHIGFGNRVRTPCRWTKSDPAFRGRASDRDFRLQSHVNQFFKWSLKAKVKQKRGCGGCTSTLRHAAHETHEASHWPGSHAARHAARHVNDDRPFVSAARCGCWFEAH